MIAYPIHTTSSGTYLLKVVEKTLAIPTRPTAMGHDTSATEVVQRVEKSQSTIFGIKCDPHDVYSDMIQGYSRLSMR